MLDNGEAGAEGQPPQRAFPKGFTGVIVMFALRFAKTFRQLWPDNERERKSVLIL
jgi:hypothetical protein